jgi:hypothetical protein
MAQAFRHFRYLTLPENPSSTFIEDAYRRAISATLSDLDVKE